ncbi:MAG: tRNA synthetase, class II [Termitinemataceae bacterium]|nr:MAG: tRNA synthetase, class II [Termitinemataceae bacterium]
MARTNFFAVNGRFVGSMDIELLKERARIIKTVRTFFDGKNYLEVDTPILSDNLIPESCLEVFKTERLPSANSKYQHIKPYWLIPSPELWMKKLIAAHKESIYQICKSFRNGESSGLMHSPEFTMLEYYTMDADYLDSLAVTEDLFDNLLCKTNSPYSDPQNYKTLEPPFIRWTMEEAFCRKAGFSLNDALTLHTLHKEARRLGLEVSPDTEEAIVYDLIFIHKVENALPKEKPVALLDYPAIVPCLAAAKDNCNMERWELYIHGIEAANCFSEERRPQTVKDFFESECAKKNKSALVTHNVDKNYYKIFKNFPRCSGVAMGLDRLIMALTGRKTIDGVLPFPMGTSKY